MKRRRFLGLSASGFGLMSMGASAGFAEGRLFGRPLYASSAPESVEDNKLRLVLSRIDMPIDAWEPLVSYAGLWRTILSDEQAREAFRAAPGKFLLQHGFSAPALRQSRQEVRLLKFISDPEMRHVAGAGNYREFLGRLRAAGLLNDDAESSLRQRIKNLLQQDLEQIRRKMNESGLQYSQVLDSEQGEELYLITQQLQAEGQITQAAAAAVVVVVVAALAATYVSVGVNVTVGINLGVAISVAVSVAVTVGGGCNYCHAEIGQLASQVPSMRENLEMTIRAARLTGQKTMETEALRDYVQTEARACIEAAESLELLKLPAEPNIRQNLLNSVGRLTCNAAGL